MPINEIEKFFKFSQLNKQFNQMNNKVNVLKIAWMTFQTMFELSHATANENEKEVFAKIDKLIKEMKLQEQIENL